MVENREFIVANGSREIYGILYIPENEVKGAVVMSHGYNGSHTHFEREGQVLAEHGYYAYAYDFCGGSAEGKSRGLDTTEMTLFTEKEDLIAVFDAISSLEAVEGKPVYLFGGSQGGCVSSLAASELKEKVPAMILYFPALMIPENWRETYKNLEEIPEVTDFWGMKLGRTFFTSMRDLSVFDRLEAYKNPVLIIYGDKDPVVPMAAMEEAVRKFGDARLVVLEGESHGFSPEGVEKALGYILEFLGA